MKAVVCHYCQVLPLAHLDIHLEDHVHFTTLPKIFFEVSITNFIRF